MNDPLTIDQLRAALRAHPGRAVTVALPGGRRVPAEFHVTEAGTVTKDFIDCSGTRRRRVTAQLQTWTGRDPEHRLTAARLTKILDTCAPVLPAGPTPVEIEYEDTVVSSYPLVAVEPEGAALVLQLGLRHTTCLARAECGQPAAVPAEAGCGCGPDCC